MKETEIAALLVEDDPGDARLVQEMLAGAENPTFRVHRADTLGAALGALKKASFDVALVDLLLPDSNGLEAFSTIQFHAPELPIVVVTGLESESVELGALEKGAQDYLVKSKFEADTLLRAMQSAVVQRPKSAGPAGTESGKELTAGTLGCKGEVEPGRRSGQAAPPADFNSTTDRASGAIGAGRESGAESI